MSDVQVDWKGGGLNMGCEWHAEGVAVYKDIPFMTSQGPITSSLAEAKVR